MAMKELRKIYLNNQNYLANIRTRIVRKSDGEMVGGEEAERVLRAIDRRIRAQKEKTAREQVLHSLGLTKVRGALGGIYWE